MTWWFTPLYGQTDPRSEERRPPIIVPLVAVQLVSSLVLHVNVIVQHLSLMRCHFIKEYRRRSGPKLMHLFEQGANAMFRSTLTSTMSKM